MTHQRALTLKILTLWSSQIYTSHKENWLLRPLPFQKLTVQQEIVYDSSLDELAVREEKRPAAWTGSISPNVDIAAADLSLRRPTWPSLRIDPSFNVPSLNLLPTCISKQSTDIHEYSFWWKNRISHELKYCKTLLAHLKSFPRIQESSHHVICCKTPLETCTIMFQSLGTNDLNMRCHKDTVSMLEIHRPDPFGPWETGAVAWQTLQDLVRRNQWKQIWKHHHCLWMVPKLLLSGLLA